MTYGQIQVLDDPRHRSRILPVSDRRVSQERLYMSTDNDVASEEIFFSHVPSSLRRNEYRFRIVNV